MWSRGHRRRRRPRRKRRSTTKGELETMGCFPTAVSPNLLCFQRHTKPPLPLLGKSDRLHRRSRPPAQKQQVTALAVSKQQPQAETTTTTSTTTIKARRRPCKRFSRKSHSSSSSKGVTSNSSNDSNKATSMLLFPPLAKRGDQTCPRLSSFWTKCGFRPGWHSIRRMTVVIQEGSSRGGGRREGIISGTGALEGPH
jgi:hypothetical protein